MTRIFIIEKEKMISCLDYNLQLTLLIFYTSLSCSRLIVTSLAFIFTERSLAQGFLFMHIFAFNNIAFVYTFVCFCLCFYFSFVFRNW